MSSEQEPQDERLEITAWSLDFSQTRQCMSIYRQMSGPRQKDTNLLYRACLGMDQEKPISEVQKDNREEKKRIRARRRNRSQVYRWNTPTVYLRHCRSKTDKKSQRERISGCNTLSIWIPSHKQVGTRFCNLHTYIISTLLVHTVQTASSSLLL